MALGTALCTAGWSDRQAQKRTFPSQLQLLWAATGSLEEKVLPLLLSCHTDVVEESKRSLLFVNFGLKQVADNRLCDMKFRWFLLELVPKQSSAHHFTQPFDHALVSE